MSSTKCFSSSTLVRISEGALISAFRVIELTIDHICMIPNIKGRFLHVKCTYMYVTKPLTVTLTFTFTRAHFLLDEVEILVFHS